MKKAALATSYKFNINRSVGMGTTIRFSLGVTKEAVGRAFKNARINPLTVAQTTIRELNIKLIESESKNASLKAKVVLLLKENAGYKKRIQSERKQMSEKKSVEEVLAKSQRGGTPWLEPMREWIKDASLLDGIAKNDDLPSKKSSLQKIFGSNLTLRNKKVEEIPVKQWATLCVARKNFSKNRESIILAPRVGFEPTTNSLTASCATTAPPGNPPILPYYAEFVKVKGLEQVRLRGQYGSDRALSCAL